MESYLQPALRDCSQGPAKVSPPSRTVPRGETDRVHSRRSADASWLGGSSGDLVSTLHGPATAPGVERCGLHSHPRCLCAGHKASERMTKRHFPSTRKKKARPLQVGPGAPVLVAPRVRAQVSGLHPGPCCGECRERRTRTRTQNSFTPVRKSRHTIKIKPSLLSICWLPQAYFENLLSSEGELLERWDSSCCDFRGRETGALGSLGRGGTRAGLTKRDPRASREGGHRADLGQRLQFSRAQQPLRKCLLMRVPRGSGPRGQAEPQGAPSLVRETDWK